MLFSLAVALSLGCGTTATIARGDNPTVEATNLAADDDYVYVGNPRRPYRIPKDDIVDIDHPGDGAIFAGSVVGGYGLVNIGVGADDCDKGAAYCVGVFTPAIVAVTLLIYGLGVHSQSESALRRKPILRSKRSDRPLDSRH